MIPKISIITPSLNRLPFIGDAFASLAAQNDPNLEHIVVDGGSEDGTLEFIRSEFPSAKLIVQSDRNVYEALNRGLQSCTGEIIGLLNTDDRFLPNALPRVREAFHSCPAADSVCGGCEIHVWDDAGATTISTYNSSSMKMLRRGDVISGLTLTNGRFFRRRVFDQIGLFDDRYPTQADRELFARFLLSKCTTIAINDSVYSYGSHKGSLTFSGMIVPSQVVEARVLSSNGLATASTKDEKSFFRSWHGWAVGYECLHSIRRRDVIACVRTGFDGLKRDFLWPLYFMKHAAWHLSTRGERTVRKLPSPSNG